MAINGTSRIKNDINKFSFYTKSQDDKNIVQNSGVMLMASAMHFSSSKDKNHVLASMDYFRIIEELWELNYCCFRVPIFKSNWVSSNGGVQSHDLGFIYTGGP